MLAEEEQGPGSCRPIAMVFEETLITILKKCKQKRTLVPVKCLYAYMLQCHLNVADCLKHSRFSARVHLVMRTCTLLLYRTIAMLFKENLIAILQKCRQNRNSDHAKCLHAYMLQHHLESHPVYGNYLVPMLVECGSLLKAQQVFDKLQYRNEYSYTSLMSGYINCGEPQYVFQLYCKMQEDACAQPNKYTYLLLLNACGRLQDEQNGQGVHSDAIKRCVEKEIQVGSTLVDMYSKCGLLLEAHKVFKGLMVRDTVSWNILIAGYTEHGLGKKALNCFQDMQLDGVIADAFTFTCILKACSTMGTLETGYTMHAEIIMKGLEKGLYVAGALVKLYTCVALLAEACIVFNSLCLQHTLLWSLLIAGYSNQGLDENVLNSFRRMQQDGVCADADIFICSLKACGNLGALERGQELHADIAKRGMETELQLSSMLVDMYGKCGSLVEVHQVFKLLPVQNFLLWNALIVVYADHGCYEEVLNCFQQMQMEGVSGDAVTFVCCLKACACIEARKTGLALYIEISKRGFERHLHVGNILVNMFARCSSFKEAQQVLEQLPVQDVVAWNGLIAGYAGQGLYVKVLNCFQQMHLKCVPANAVTFLCGLKACDTTEALQAGQEIHIETVKRGLESELYVGNTLVVMYGRCCSLAEAFQILDKLPFLDAVSWNACMSSFIEQGLVEEISHCFEQIQLAGLSADIVTFVSSLKACEGIDRLDTGHRVHAEIIKRGFEIDLYIGSSLLNMYSKCDSLAAAHQVFNRLPTQNVISWNALISGYVKHGLVEPVLDCIKQMYSEGLFPDAVTFVLTLKACGATGAIETGRELHFQIRKLGLGNNMFMGNVLVDMYGRCGSVAEAHGMFELLQAQDTVSWNVLIACYTEYGLSEEAINCFWQMQVNGITPNVITFVCTLKACCTIGSVETGQKLHVEIVKRGLESGLHIGTTLLDMYAKHGLLVEAHGIFDRLPIQNAVTWTALAAGCTGYRLDEVVLDYFKHMQLKGIFMDAVAFIPCLKTCGAIGALETGWDIHTQIIKKGIDREPYISSRLVEMYGKCNSFEEAHQVFDRSPIQHALLWTALITVYLEHGLADHVLTIFKKMQLEGVPMDPVVLVLCLKACGMVGALEIGRKIHTETRKLGLERNAFVGNMLIYMYGKCGSVAEGQEVFDKLLVRDVFSWTSIIKIHGDNHEGKKAVEYFERMQGQNIRPNAITFTCLLAACSQAGLALEGLECFRLMKEFKIEPRMVHYGCMVDLLARSGHVYEAQRLIQAIQCVPSQATLMALLIACKIYGRLELGQRCFQKLVMNTTEERYSKF